MTAATTYLTDHLTRLVHEGRRLAPGQGTSLGDARTGLSSRVGRTEADYYADVAWLTMEGDGDDPASRTCWCRLRGRMHQHAHRRAATLAGLLEAPQRRGSARDA